MQRFPMKIDYQVNFGEAKISLEAVCLLSNGFGTGSLAVAALSRKRGDNRKLLCVIFTSQCGE